MTARLERYSRALAEAFSTADRHRAHELARPILAELGGDDDVLRDIVCKNMGMPGFFERIRINPVIALEVAKDEHFELVANLWLPLDDRSTDLTHQSVHHHGSMLLTSISAWGPGYESILFKSGFRVSDRDGSTEMEIDKIYKNPKGHAEFVPAHTPHVVLFPSDLTVTYALWSSDRVRTATSWVRKIPMLQAYKKRIKAGLHRFGLASRLNLNVVENFDFYPNAGRLMQMKTRVMYSPGTRANYLDNFFWCLQRVEFDRLGFLKRSIDDAVGDARRQATELLNRLERGDLLSHQMDPAHVGVDRAQISRQALQACFLGHRLAAGSISANGPPP